MMRHASAISLLSLCLGLALGSSGCVLFQTGEVQALGAVAELGPEWRDLLPRDVGLSGWRGYRSDELPEGWVLDDGVLSHDGRWGSRDLITRERFRDFEFDFEWRASEGGNSGVIYRFDESRSFSWRSGAEYQVLDPALDERPRNRAAAYYDVESPAQRAKPAGEWNHGRIVAKGKRIEHWLNGKRALVIEVGSDNWKRSVAESKFAGVEGWGELAEGYIALQAHFSAVDYRNLRIRSPQP